MSKLPPMVLVQSGLVPCVSAPLSVTLQNFGDKCVVLPKYTVLGEVFLLHPSHHEAEFQPGFDNEEEEKRRLRMILISQ